MQQLKWIGATCLMLSAIAVRAGETSDSEDWHWEADLGLSAQYVRGFVDDKFDDKGELALSLMLIGGAYYKDFYVELSPHTRHPLTLGYSLNKTPTSQLSLVAESYFVTIADTPENTGDKLTGIDDRLASLEGGVDYLREYHEYEIRIRLLHDLLDRHNGSIATLEIARPIYTRKVFYLPSIGFTYLSASATDYYFGVRPWETNQVRSEYKAGNGFVTSLRLYAERPMGDSWSVVGFATYNLINSAIADSPIVYPHKDAFNIGIGAVWSF